MAKNKWISFRVSEEEYEAIAKNAEQHGMSVSTFVRAMLIEEANTMKAQLIATQQTSQFIIDEYEKLLERVDQLERGMNDASD